MPKSITPKKLVKLLGSLGFYIVRQRGSHIVMSHKDGRRTVIPMHGRDSS